MTLIDQLVTGQAVSPERADSGEPEPRKPQRRRWGRTRVTKAERLAREAATAADIKAKWQALWARLDAEELVRQARAAVRPEGVRIVEGQGQVGQVDQDGAVTR